MALSSAPQDFVRTIGTVIDLAVDVINRPGVVSRLPALTELALTVDTARAAMVEGGNPIRAEVNGLLDVLAQIEAERQMGAFDRAERWCMVAGVLLPMVRGNLADALQRRASRATTADQEHFRRRADHAV